MACTVYCRAVLNQVFANVVNMGGRYVGLKKKYLPVLKECIPLMFSRVNYPYNVGGELSLLLFVTVTATHKEASVFVKIGGVNLPPMENEELEAELKKRNMVPEFLKNVKVLRIQC